MKRVLVTEPVAQDGLDFLRNEGIAVEERFNLRHDELKKIIGEYDAVITRSGTRITKDILENPGKLRVIGRAGVGLDNVDVEEASKKGIIVINAPGGNTVAACELTMAMILNTARKIPEAHYSLKYNRKWERKKFMGVEIQGKILGIVGLGNVGSAVAKRAKAFGMTVKAYDPYIKKSKATDLGVELVETLDELLMVSDIITFHTPLTRETYNMIRKEQIEKLKDGAILINCARGGIINESDLFDALKSGKVAACGIDTFENEPAVNNPLLDLGNVYVTPHIGANSEESQANVSLIVSREIANVLSNRPYKNAVNIPFMKEFMSTAQKSYFELCEKMGLLLAQLIEGRPKELQITMVGKFFEEDIVTKAFDVPFNYQPFTVAAIKGFLKSSIKEDVTYMGAPYFAKDSGIVVSEAKAENYGNYNNLIIFKVSTDRETKMVGATVYEDGSKKIVFIDDFKTDIVPQGFYLYIINNDKPGTIGKIGILLGDHGINIAGFHLSRQKGGFAMSFVQLDDPIGDDLLNKLKRIDNIIVVKPIKF